MLHFQIFAWSVCAVWARQFDCLQQFSTVYPVKSSFCTGIQFSCEAIDLIMQEAVNSLQDSQSVSQAASQSASLLSLAS